MTAEILELRTPPSLPEVAGPLVEELQTAAHAPDPYPIYGRLRREWPVAEVFGAVSLVRYADVETVLRHPLVSSDDRHSRAHQSLLEAQKLAPQYLAQMDRRSFLHRDPPDHTRLRRLVSRAFTPRRVEDLRPTIEGLVDEILDRAAERKRIDLVGDLAYPLPIAVISRLIGVPPEDRPIVESWPRAQLCCSFEPSSLYAAATAETSDPDGRERAAPAAADLIQEQLESYFDVLMEQRRKQPGDDLVSALIAAEEHGDQLTPDEINATLRLLFVAGYETTVNLIGNGMLALLRHPDQLAALRHDPALVAGAVDETLRYDAPFQFTRRIALDDLDVGGYRIPGGTTILLWLAAANRDPARFADPDRFDITRTDNRHLGFGTGIHACLGAPLARLQGAVVFHTLARRLVAPHLEADPPPYRQDVFHALQDLPVAFDLVRPAT